MEARRRIRIGQGELGDTHGYLHSIAQQELVACGIDRPALEERHRGLGRSMSEHDIGGRPEPVTWQSCR